MSSHVSIHGRNHRPGGVDPIPGLLGTGIPGVSYGDYVTSLSNLLAYWRLGESAAPFADTSGRFPGSPSNLSLVSRGAAATFDQTGALPAPDDDGAAEFNSAGTVGDYLSGVYGSRFNLSAGFTISAWVKVEASASTFTGAVVTNHVSSPPGGWGLFVNWPARTVSIGWGRTGPVYYYATSPGSLAVDTWYHLVGTWDASQLELWINGTSVDTTPTTGSPEAFGGDVQLGGAHPNTSLDYYFNGTIDEVAIFDAVLTDEEIAGLYESGVTGSPGSSEPAGKVLTSDGAGGTSWQYVGSEGLEDEAVTTEKIAAGAVTPEKIAAGTDDYVLKTVAGAVAWARSTVRVNY